MRNDFELAGKKCHTYVVGDGGPVVFWGTMDRGNDPVGSMIELIEKQEDDLESFVLFAFEADDWNNDFSPWVYDAGEGQKFGKGGDETLSWLKSEAIPYAAREFPHSHEYAVAGYSLSGLFALWSFYASGLFRGVACCSGSLWFEGWDKFADGSRTPENGVVYLSLGGKEPGSGNLLTASIGVQYLKQKKRHEKDPNLRAFNYILNSGGHFSDPVGRVAKGIFWLVEELSVY